MDTSSDRMSQLGFSLVFLCALLLSVASRAAEGKTDTVDQLLNAAQAAQLKGDSRGALVLAERAVAIAPENPQCYYVRGRVLARQGQYSKAIADFDRVIEKEPRAAEVYQLRGVEHFKAGHFDKSIADFDKYISFAPQQAPHHWQRGIACYYAGRYEEGRKQFESHQTVNPNDVENAVWHYLCVARAHNAQEARAALLPIKGDRRVPMMQIYALFAGKARPEDVMTAAKADDPTPAEYNDRQFYAHLYVGLYYEAQGKTELTREHILKAANEYPVNHYMGDVARVHARLLQAPSGASSPAQP